MILGKTVARDTLLADLHHELAVERELQHVAVRRTVAANPDVAAAVDVESVVAVGPLIAGTVAAAPVAEQIAGLIELENRRRGVAAFAGRRRLARCAFRRVQRVWPMNDPDVVLRINPEPDRLTLIPAVGQRLGEGRIDLEARRHHAVLRLRRGDALHGALRERQSNEKRHEASADQQVPFHRCRSRDVAYLTTNFCTRLP